MKIDIRTSELRQGFVRKKSFIDVATRVQFNEEERAIIHHRKLEHDVVLEREAPFNSKKKKSRLPPVVQFALSFLKPQNTHHLTIAKLIKGVDRYPFATPLEAKVYEAELVEKFQQLKAYIMGNAEVSPGQSFEL